MEAYILRLSREELLALEEALAHRPPGEAGDRAAYVVDVALGRHEGAP